jgi:hypothetical protein
VLADERALVKLIGEEVENDILLAKEISDEAREITGENSSKKSFEQIREEALQGARLQK